MKNKIKKWNIVLMSFIVLFVTVCASLFNLKADPIDNETGEILTDNWELGIVFYDSSVDNGKTPLTEINWDASDNGYEQGTPRVITVQINYKNTSAITTYQPGELEISIPNLTYFPEEIYNYDPHSLLSSSIIVGANDSSHSGYFWNFANGESPSVSDEIFYFTNANTIEEKSNFEGSIQIEYTIIPRAEAISGASAIERYENYCIHNFSTKLQASLNQTGKRIVKEEKLQNTEHIITSPNWPNNYDNSMSIANNYWEYTSPTLENLSIYFDSISETESKYDKIYIYDKTGTCLYTLSGTEMAGKTYNITGNYVKIAMSSDHNNTKKGFFASIGNGEIIVETIIPENTIISNEIEFNYTRTYIHPWQRNSYTLTKYAYPITSIDLLPNANNYIWVKYAFRISAQNPQVNYPYINADNYKIKDSFPEHCVVIDSTYTQLYSEDNTYYFEGTTSDIRYNNYIYQYAYIGYPKEIYNDESGNLNITNYAELYTEFNDTKEYEYQDNSEVSLNLSNFYFEYSGELYGLSKKSDKYTDIFYESISGIDNNLNGTFRSELNITVRYTGEPMDIQIGDDLLYITDLNGDYRKLENNEYYFSKADFPSQLKNGHGTNIPANKYDIELWVKTKDNSEYTYYDTFKNINVNSSGYNVTCKFRKNCASVPEERSAIPLQTAQSSTG